MRGVFKRPATAALLLVLLAVSASTALAEETIGPPDPPESRVRPPIGATSRSPMNPPSNAVDSRHRRDVVAHARIQPPVGANEETLMDVFFDWLNGRLATLVR